MADDIAIGAVVPALIVIAGAIEEKISRNAGKKRLPALGLPVNAARHLRSRPFGVAFAESCGAFRHKDE